MILSIFLCCFSMFLSLGQSYIDSGIRHFNANEYQEAILDFDEAEKAKALFTAQAVAKLHFYQGMTLYRLADLAYPSANMLRIHRYFGKSLALDSAWFSKINEAEVAMLDALMGRAKDLYKQASREKEKTDKADRLEKCLSILKMAEEILMTPEVEIKLAECHHEIGDLFFENVSEVISLQKAGSHYASAIKYYEVARYNDPFSKAIIEKLLILSKRMDDPARVKEYSDLIVLAGG